MRTLRFAAGYARRHTLALAVLLALMPVAAVLAAAVPWPLKYAIDDVLMPGGSRSAAGLVRAAAAMVGIVVGKQVVLLAQRRLEVGVSRSLTLEAGADLFARLQRVSLTDARRYRIGEVVTRITRDASAVQQLVLGVGLAALRNLVFIGVYTVILWRFDPLSAAIAWAVVAGQILVARRFTAPTDRATTRRAQGEADVMARADVGLSGRHDIAVNGAIEREIARFAATSHEAFDAARRSDTLLLLFGLNASVISALGNGILLMVGTLRVFSGDLTVGSLVVILAYVASLQAPAEGLAYAIPEAAGAWARSRRLIEFLATAEPVTVVEPSAQEAVTVVADDGADVAFVEVGYAYGDTPALHDVSFHAPAGSVTALVGPTGGGKTTLVSLLPRLIDPTTGTITINGVDHRRIPLHDLRQLIAVVRQDPYLFPTTIADNLAYGRPDATDDEIVDAATAANAHHFITALPDGYHTRIGDGGAGLSGGQKQRLAIARALLKNAPILVLDEPTSALDAETEAEVMTAIDHLTAGRTVLVIAHRLSTIRNADTIIVIDHGHIREHGTHHELLTANDLYHTLYTTQLRAPGATA